MDSCPGGPVMMTIVLNWLSITYLWLNMTKNILAKNFAFSSVRLKRPCSISSPVSNISGKVIYLMCLHLAILIHLPLQKTMCVNVTAASLSAPPIEKQTVVVFLFPCWANLWNQMATLSVLPWPFPWDVAHKKIGLNDFWDLF